MHPMLNIATQAARCAGSLLVRSMDSLEDRSLSAKARCDFIAQLTGLIAEEVLALIHKAYPRHGIFSKDLNQTGEDKEYCWLINSLDGEVNFIHGFAVFAVVIVLMVKGKPEVAVVYDPLRQELFSATRGGGAHRNNRRMRVSACQRLNDALLSSNVIFARDDSAAWVDSIKPLLPLCQGIRMTGTVALDLAYVACGSLSGFFAKDVSLCDRMAAVLLITQAGGVVSDLQGGDSFLDQGDLLCAPPKLHQALLETLAVVPQS